jgi:hypothetical protein
MKKFTLSILVTFALCATTAVAQSGGQRSSPTMGPANSQQQQPGMQQPGHQPGTMPDQTSPTAQTDQNTANQNQSGKTEKTLKGCVESQGGQYVLETKKGNVALMGQDVSAHVGHEVKVKGNWEKGSAGNTSAAGTAESSASAKSFDVSSVDMVSATCKMKGKGSTSGMGTGTGTGTSNQPQ